MEKTFEELIEPFKKYENFWLFDLQQNGVLIKTEK